MCISVNVRRAAPAVYTAGPAPAMRVGHTPRLGAAPRVDYRDWEDFAGRCAELQSTYTELVQSAVTRRQLQTQTFTRPSNSAYPFFTPRDLLLVGLAEFTDLRRPGLAGALSVARSRWRRRALCCTLALAVRSWSHAARPSAHRAGDGSRDAEQRS